MISVNLQAQNFPCNVNEIGLKDNMVSDFHGGKPVRVRKPHLITNQDDSTQFICQGKQIDNSARVGLVASTALKTQSTLSVYHQDDDNKMNGLRVKRHLLTNARGDVAPACYCFAGLTEYEMPDDEFIIWEVEGLCIGGYGAYCSTGIGYILFMRGTPGAEKKRFQWIRENMLFPFINWSRKEYDGIEAPAAHFVRGDKFERQLLKVGQSKNPALRLAFALATFQASGEFEPALRDWEAKPKAFRVRSVLDHQDRRAQQVDRVLKVLVVLQGRRATGGGRVGHGGQRPWFLCYEKSRSFGSVSPKIIRSNVELVVVRK